MDNKINGNDTEVLKTENKNTETELSHSEHSHHGEHHHGEHHHHHHGEHHHSEHHHHSRHHSGRHGHHSDSNKKKKKLNVNKKYMWILSISLMVLLLVCLATVEITNFNKYTDDSPKSDEILSDSLVVEVINNEGVLVKEAVRKYLLLDMLNSYNANALLMDFNNNEGRLDAQVPVALKLSTKDGSAISYKIELANNDRFNNASVHYIDGSSDTYEFKHLYVYTQYFYRVTAYMNNGVALQIGSFKTADTPRILSIDGLSNVRDIGNWKTDSGKRIKQGLLIRGTEMDGAVESEYHLTNEGLKDMLDVFGIVTDIDLRAQTATSMDALGSCVEHRYYDMIAYEGIFTHTGQEKIRMVFADLANSDIYPIYLHCTYGSDRTGTVCYLLEALLGVSRGDCLKDYGLSNMNIANIQKVENGLSKYEGDTLKEQVESYLLACGVTEYQIESIRNIFLGD